MKIKCVPVGVLKTNCYLLFCDQSDEVVLIDPAFEHEKIEAALEGKKIGAVVLTHGHFDHIFESAYFRDTYGCPVYASLEEKPYFSDYDLNTPHAMFSKTRGMEFQVDRWLKDGDTVTFGTNSFLVRVYAGHTYGGAVLIGNGIMIAGDMLFRGSVGRTDFYGGDPEKMAASLIDLMQYEDSLTVYPGHGEPTTVGLERRENWFIKQLV